MSSDIYHRTFIKGRIVDIHFILGMLSSSIKQSITLYRDYMEEASEESEKEYEDSIFLEEEVYRVSQSTEKIEGRKSLQFILQETGKVIGVNKSTIYNLLERYNLKCGNVN